MNTDLEAKAFICGYAAAAASIARDHGEDMLAEFLMEGSGFDLQALREAKVDEYDMKPLRPILAEIVNRQRRLKKHRETLARTARVSKP